MATKQEANLVAVELVPSKNTRTMLGTYFDETKQEWMIASAEFDPISGAVGSLKRERVAGDEEVMRERITLHQIRMDFWERERM